MPERPRLDYTATLGACLRRAASLFADRDFIVLPDRSMTFAEVESASRDLARRMLAAGIGKGTRVGLYYTYGPEFCVAWFAALRIGALAMPFSTLSKPAELRKALRLGDLHTLVVPSRLFGRDVPTLLEQAVPELASGRPRPLMVEGLPYLRAVWVTGKASDTSREWAEHVHPDSAPDGPCVSDALLEQVESEVTPADLAQVTYTSGSSDLPKGVTHSHGAIVRNSSPQATEAAMRSVGMSGPVRRVFCGFPFFWIGGTLVLGQAVQSGWTVHCLERFEPGPALDVIELNRVDRVWAWPSLVQAMRTDPSFAGRDVAYLDKVLPKPPIVTGASGAVPRHRGMSETMGNWFGVDYKVIDAATGDALPQGREGELCVRGYAVTQGYYKREREDTFDADGWLHTGDRVVVTGVPHFVGRHSEMIKSRGANVSPREVEVVLERIEGVRHAVVIGLPHPEREEEVTAVLVPAPGATIDLPAVIAVARAELSSFKVPTRVEVLDDDALPWLPTGKPDKRELRRRLLDVPAPPGA